MTNEQIVSEIKSGNKELINQLWLQTERFVYKQAHLFFNRYRLRCDQLGVTVEDLHQEGYFGIVDAVSKYEPEKNVRFLTYADYHCKKQFFKIAKMRSTGWQNNPFHTCASLDELRGDGEINLFDSLPDDASAQSLDDVIEREFTEQVRKDVENAMTSLTDHQANIIVKRFYEGMRPVEIARERNVQRASLSGPFKSAFEKLRNDENLKQDWLSLKA